MNRSGATSFYEADGLGSITSLTDGSGSAVGVYTYDTFGKVTSPANSISNPFQYTGREWDQETNLYYYRARYYEPLVGRFITEDPAKFGTGSNFFIYVNNSAPNRRDPSGLDPSLDGNITILLNIFPGSKLGSNQSGKYLRINRPCPEVFRTLLAQGYETGHFPPFNNPKDHAGGFEFRTRGTGPGFHFRMPYSPDPTDPTGMGPLAPCPNKFCTLDQFHMDQNNPLGGNVWEHFKDFLSGR